MSVQLVTTIVIRMQPVMTQTARTHATVMRDSLEMDSLVAVRPHMILLVSRPLKISKVMLARDFYFHFLLDGVDGRSFACFN